MIARVSANRFRRVTCLIIPQFWDEKACYPPKSVRRQPRHLKFGFYRTSNKRPQHSRTTFSAFFQSYRHPRQKFWLELACYFPKSIRRRPSNHFKPDLRSLYIFTLVFTGHQIHVSDIPILRFWHFF